MPTSKYREIVGKEMFTMDKSREAIKIDEQTTVVGEGY